MAVFQSLIIGSGGRTVPCFLEFVLDSNNKITRQVGVTLTDAVDIGDNVLYNVCYTDEQKTEITGSAFLNSTSLKRISGYLACTNAFARQQGITETGMDSVEVISGVYACQNMFEYCRGLTKSGLGSLKTLSGAGACNNMFLGCSNLVDAEMENLETISMYQYYMFRNCTKLETVDFAKLSSLNTNQAMYRFFWGSTALKNIYFRALKSTSFGNFNTVFKDMLFGVTGCTVHFPSNLQSTIGSWTDVTGGFGGTNTTVLFDLTATE